MFCLIRAMGQQWASYTQLELDAHKTTRLKHIGRVLALAEKRYRAVGQRFRMQISRLRKHLVVGYPVRMGIPLETIIPLLHNTTYGVLATHSAQMPGYSFASGLPFMPDERHRPVFLISALAEHTKNLLEDLRASFLVCSPDGKNIPMSARLTVVGDVMPVDASPDLTARYLRYQPDAKQYLDLGNFAFFRLSPKRARYIAGFGEMGWVTGGEWTDGAVLELADEAKLYRDLIAVLPMGIRLLGVDRYGVDIERQGKRERQQFPNAPLSEENVCEVIKRFLAAI